MSTGTLRSGLIVAAIAAAVTFLAVPSAFADPPPTHVGGGATGATTGGAVTAAKPAGGAGSAGDKKKKCDQLRAVLNQDLQDLGGAQASGDKGSAAVAQDYAETDLRAGDSMGCGWAK